MVQKMSAHFLFAVTVSQLMQNVKCFSYPTSGFNIYLK